MLLPTLKAVRAVVAWGYIGRMEKKMETISFEGSLNHMLCSEPWWWCFLRQMKQAASGWYWTERPVKDEGKAIEVACFTLLQNKLIM